MKNLKFSILAAATILFAASCDKDDPIPVNEEEVITTVIVRLTTAAGATVTLTSKDIDGDGPGMPVVTQTGTVQKGTNYLGTVSFLNEQKTPVDDITAEVKAEGDEHQVFYMTASTLGTIAYDDLDTNGKPVGLKFKLTTAATANTTPQNLAVTLIHKPVKTAVGVVGGNIANAGGATDAEVTYRVVLAD